MPWEDGSPQPGVVEHPTRLGEAMPVGFRSDAELDAALRRIVRVEAALAAYETEIVALRARRPPAASDLAPGVPGAAAPQWAPRPEDDPLVGVSEFSPDELAMTLACSRAAATTLTDVSLILVERLPATWAALADGALDWPRARALAQELSHPVRECAPEVVAEVEAAVLPRPMELSVPRLRARGAARAAGPGRRRGRRAEEASRAIGRRDGALPRRRDGRAAPPVPAPVGAAMTESVDTYARMATADGDPPPLGRLRVAFLADLCCLCRRHHRLKTHAPGWRFALDRDGTLHVTTPTGVTRATRPPGLDLLRGHAPDDPSLRPPPRAPLSATDDDPPPF
jgi:hypothetical protein